MGFWHKDFFTSKEALDKSGTVLTQQITGKLVKPIFTTRFVIVSKSSFIDNYVHVWARDDMMNTCTCMHLVFVVYILSFKPSFDILSCRLSLVKFW